MNHKKILERAANIGNLRSTHSRYRMGAILISHKPKMVIVGFNQIKTHPKTNSHSGFIHAEFDAIRKAQKFGVDLTKSELFVGRLRKDGRLGLARPCEHCQAIIDWYGIKSVYFTGDPKGGGK